MLRLLNFRAADTILALLFRSQLRMIRRLQQFLGIGGIRRIGGNPQADRVGTRRNADALRISAESRSSQPKPFPEVQPVGQRRVRKDDGKLIPP